MERVLNVFGQSENSMKPELLLVYGGLAVLVTGFVNWTLGIVLMIMQPVTCAAILLAFFRPDLAQNIFQDEHMKQVMGKTKVVLRGLFEIACKIGEHLRERIN